MADHGGLSASEVAAYLVAYAERYRREYARFTAPPPDGAGYPALLPSPYVSAGTISCYIAEDGFVVADQSGEPPNPWYVAGGPALLIDTEPSRSPPWVERQLRDEGLWGTNIGIYRIVAKTPLSPEEWTGSLPVPCEQVERCTEELSIVVKRYDVDWRILIARLTFGAIGTILDFHVPDSSSSFWNPHKVRRLGFCTADRQNRRWFSLMELSPHVGRAAWDHRSIPARVNVDLRRDFLDAVASLEMAGGFFTIAGPNTEAPLDLTVDRLRRLTDAIDGLQVLLEEQEGAPESTFHEYLERNPILLDVYAEAVSKPRFVYPPGASPFGKSYVEPDFVLKYPDGRYRLVELERPSKGLATKRGEPRSEVSQAVFQVAEWRDYINHHYDLISDRFPGISSTPMSTVVISRDTANVRGDIPLHRYLAVLREQFAVDEVITYDDLVLRARVAALQIAGATGRLSAN